MATAAGVPMPTCGFHRAASGAAPAWIGTPWRLRIAPTTAMTATNVSSTPSTIRSIRRRASNGGACRGGETADIVGMVPVDITGSRADRTVNRVDVIGS